MTAPAPDERLANLDGVLTRTDLRALGWERRAVDAIFRELDVVVVPGYRRPHVRVRDYLAFLHDHTYGRGRVRLCR